MTFLNPQDSETIRRRFAADLEDDVRLLLFVPAAGGLTLPGQDAQLAEYTRQILREVAEHSDRIRVEEHSLVTDRDTAARYGVTMSPTVVFLGREDFGVRYIGIPAGYEFVTLLDVIIATSRGRGEVSDETRQALTALPGEAHLQVFVTPT